MDMFLFLIIIIIISIRYSSLNFLNLLTHCSLIIDSIHKIHIL